MCSTSPVAVPLDVRFVTCGDDVGARGWEEEAEGGGRTVFSTELA